MERNYIDKNSNAEEPDLISIGGSENTKMENLCRICLALDVKLLSLDINEHNCSLSEMLAYFTNLSIDPGDGLPSTICASCKTQLVQCYEFKQKCIKSDETLKSIGGKLKQEDSECMPAAAEDGSEEKLPSIDMKGELQEDTDEQYLEDFSEFSIDDDPYLTEKPRKVKSPVLSRKKDKRKKESTKIAKDDQIEFENENIIKKYVCTICSKKYFSMQSLRNHIKNNHSGSEEPYSCKICKKTLGSEHDLKVHKSMHNKTDYGWKCNQCNKEFKAKSGIRRHIMRHMKSKQYGCDLCDKTFSEMHALNRHLRVHTGVAPEKQHQCSICDKRFVENRSLIMHMRGHNDERPYVCAECGKTFPSERLLQSHERVHSLFKPYTCKYCDKRFRHESSRTTHHRTHTGEKPYVCSYCGKTFIQNSNLTLHMRIHTGSKPHKCETCGHQFTSSSSLKVHIRSHTGEKPYSCTVCGKKFARMDIKSHMRVHTGERPHQCNVCARRFSKLSALADHYKVHTGEQPYECNRCSQKFRTKTHLKKHLSQKKKKKSNKAIKRNQENKKATVDKRTENKSKDKLVNVFDSVEETNKNMDATNSIIFKIEPLEGPREIILTNNCDVKNEVVFINKTEASNFQNKLCLSSNELTSNFVDSMNLVAINESDINISAASSNTLQASTVSLYQVDQSLVQIHSEGGSVTISKITSKVTANF